MFDPRWRLIDIMLSSNLQMIDSTKSESLGGGAAKPTLHIFVWGEGESFQNLFVGILSKSTRAGWKIEIKKSEIIK